MIEIKEKLIFVEAAECVCLCMRKGRICSFLSMKQKNMTCKKKKKKGELSDEKFGAIWMA